MLRDEGEDRRRKSRIRGFLLQLIQSKRKSLCMNGNDVHAGMQGWLICVIVLSRVVVVLLVGYARPLR